MAVVQFVLNVTEPYASGIGGGCFIMIYDAKSGEVVAVDGREEAPAAYTEDVFMGPDGKPLSFVDAFTGGNSVGVPGTLAAIARVLDEYGTISLADAVKPAVLLARNGYTIDSYFADQIAGNAERISQFPATAAIYLDPDGNPWPEGTVIKNPDLADTLELIGDQGIGVLYGGEVGADIVDTVTSATVNPGVMALSDLENYIAVKRQPVTTNYRGYDVYGMNMPTSGGTTLMLMLNLLEGFDMASMPFDSLDMISTMANVQNVAFADRNQYMADADFVDVNVDGLLDKGYARDRRALIQPNAAVSTPVSAGEPPVIEMSNASPYVYGLESADTENISTTHFSIVDKDRNMVAITTTIEQFFGSGLVVPGRGFLLNNEMTDFSFEYQDANGNPIANAPTGDRMPRKTALGDDATTVGGKRPRSSMNPTLVLKDGQPFMAVGSPGGSRIIAYVFNVVVDVLDYGMDIQAAVNAPRIVARNGGIGLDDALLTPGLQAGLQARGFSVGGGNTGSVQAVVVGDDGMLYGAADPRRNGLALGQ